METIECSKCGAVFERTGAKDKLRRFKDKRFMTTFHCPNCDARVILKNGEEPITIHLKRLERLKEQARRLGDKQEVNELQEEIDQIHGEIKMNAEKTKDKKFSVKGNDAYDPTKPKNIAKAKALSVAQGKAASDAKDDVNHLGEKVFHTYESWRVACKRVNPNVVFEGNRDICNAKPGIGEWDGVTGVIYKTDDEAYDPLDPENILKEKELAKARGAAATDAKVEVKQQSDVGSNQWGIYVDGKLVEGGFFSKSAAEEAAVQYNKDSKTKDSLFKGQKVTAIKSEQGLREGETYTVLGEEKIIKQIVGEGDKIVYKLQDSSGNIVVIEDCDDLFYEVKDSLIPLRQNMSSKEVEYKVGGQWKPIEGKVKAAYENEQIKYDRADGGYHYYTCEVKDATNSMGERSFRTYESWKRACKEINPSVQFEGDKDICQAKPGIGEWDGAEGIIYNTKTKDEVGIGRYKGFEMYQTGNNLFSATNYSSSIVPSASFSAPSIEELKNKIDQHVDRVSRGIMTGNYDSRAKEKELEEAIVLNIKAGNYNLAEKLKKELEEEKQKETIAQTFGDDDKEDSDATENDPLKVKIGDIRKNMDAARKMGFDTAPYQKEIDKLEVKDDEGQVVISNKEMSKYNRLKEKGYKTVWVGEGKICMALPNKIKDEKFPVGSYVRVNIMGSKPEKVIRRDGTTVWTNKGTYHETKVVAVNDSKVKDGEDQLIGNYEGYKIVFNGGFIKAQEDGFTKIEFPSSMGVGGWSRVDVQKMFQKIDMKESGKDSKVKDDNQVVQIYRGVEILYDDAHGIYWCKYKGKTLTFEDNDLGRLKKKIDDYFEETEDSKVKDAKTKDEIINYNGVEIIHSPHLGYYYVTIQSKFGNGEYAGPGFKSLSEAKEYIDKNKVKGAKNPRTKDSFTGIESIKIELKEAEADLARAREKGDVNWIRDASGYVAELKNELKNWHKYNDSSDFYTKDPLTEKGKKILEAMKKIYGEEKGEQIFYASRNKGTIENVDKNTSDSLSDMDKKQLAQGKKFKIVLPSGMGEPLYTNSFSAAVEMSKEYGKGTTVVDLTKATDSKTKDAELTVPELKNKALTKVLRDFYEGVKEIYSPATVAGAQKLTQMIESETDPIKLKRWAGLDSKTKDKNADWSVRFIASGYGTLTDWLNDKNNAINDFNRFKNLNKEQIGEKLGINDDLVNRLSEVRLLDDKGNTVQSYRVQDSKTKDYNKLSRGSVITFNYKGKQEHGEIIGLDDSDSKSITYHVVYNIDPDKAVFIEVDKESGRHLNVYDSGTKDDYKTMKLADLLKKAKEGYFELQSDPKPRNHIEIRYPNGKKEWIFVEDQEIKITIGEDSVNPNPAEQKVEGNDILYKEYTLKQLPETGEFEIYSPGGTIIGHAKALELAKLFVDRIVASKIEG